MKAIHFFVPGRPVPGGSKRAFIIHQKGCPAGRRHGKGACVCRPFTNVSEAAGQANKDWRSEVVQFAYEATKENGQPILPLFSGAIAFDAHFWLPRPKYHYTKGGILANSSPHYHVIKPDVLKLARAVEDALTGIIWTDDSIIVSEMLRKDYATRWNVAGVLISVSLLEDPQTVIEWKDDERPVRLYTLRDPREQNVPSSD